MRMVSQKITTAFILIACMHSFLYAQKKDTTSHRTFYKNEVSLDMFYFLNILRGNFSPTTSPQMAVAIEHHLSEENLIRLGSDVRIQNYNVYQATQPTLQNNSTFYILRLGAEKEKEFHPLWTFFYGFDLLYKYSLKQNEQGNSTLGITRDINKTEGQGFALLFGMKFKIANRVTLSVETDFELWKYMSNLSTTNDLSPQLNKSYNEKGIYTDYSIPQNIFMNIEF